MTYSIKETSEMVTFLARLVSAADAAYADGKVTLIDGYLLLDPIKVAGSAIQGVELIPKEAGDLQDYELKELLDIVQAELELRSENAKEITLDVLNLAGQLALVLRKIREMKNQGEVPTEVPELPLEDEVV